MPTPSTSPGRHARALVGASLLVLASAGQLACSQANAERTNEAQQSIAGGTLDVSHQDVFLLGWHEGQIGGLCTATLIAPNLLLTARHCVSPNSGDSDRVLCGEAGLGEPRAADAFFATNDAQPRQNSPFFRAREVRVPEAGVDTCGFDIALIVLDQNVPATLSTPAIPRIDRDATPGEGYTAVGYGLTGNGEASGSRMQLAGLSVACQPGSCGEGVESTEFLGETGICSGDSGGPALDADGKVLGVVSRGGPECSEPIYGSVAAWRDFIISTAEEAAALGEYEAPFWVTTGSSDAPVLPGVGGASGETTRGAEGDTCHDGGECKSGLVCYASSSRDVGSCTLACSTTADCGDGLVCQPAGSVSVCVAPSESEDDSSGCAVSAPGTRPRWLALLLAAGAGLTLFRRRSASARRC
jgi:hypothetical protein